MSTGLPVSFALVMGGALLFTGFFIGRMITLMNKKRRNKIDDESPVTDTVSAAEVPAPLADPAKYTELLRLWRGKENNGLFVETSGHLLASSSPLNPAQKKRFISLIKELAVWLDIPLTDIFPTPVPIIKPVEPSPVYAMATANVPAVIGPVNIEPLIKAGTPVKTDPIPAPPAPIQAAYNPGVQVQSPVPSVSYTPVPPVPVKPSVKPAVEPAKKPTTSMVEQIDEILQEIIQRSESPNRLIRIMEERQEGVIVWVGQEHFSGIDAVTDTSAKELIRAAAKEWERRAEPRI